MEESKCIVGKKKGHKLKQEKGGRLEQWSCLYLLALMAEHCPRYSITPPSEEHTVSLCTEERPRPTLSPQSPKTFVLSPRLLFSLK